MATSFQRLIALFKSGKKSEVIDFTPPDPAIEFPHPENASLFNRLRGDSTIGIPGVMGGYETRTHPDLTSILYDLIADALLPASCCTDAGIESHKVLFAVSKAIFSQFRSIAYRIVSS